MPDRETRSIIVKADTPLAFRLWSDFENFPRFMKYVQAVEKTGPHSSHWTVKGPLGRPVHWTAETTGLEENRRIGWNTKDGQGLTTSGEVTFNPLSNGATEIMVTLQYVPPAGKAGEMVADLFADPGKRLEEDLRNFKAYAESQARASAPQPSASDAEGGRA
jgi:uncharacterized membrane protein